MFENICKVWLWEIFEYLLEYLPAISEYSIDLMAKRLKFISGEPFELNSDFILSVGLKDPRTYKVLEMYIDDELRTQTPGLL